MIVLAYKVANNPTIIEAEKRHKNGGCTGETNKENEEPHPGG